MFLVIYVNDNIWMISLVFRALFYWIIRSLFRVSFFYWIIHPCIPIVVVLLDDPTLYFERCCSLG